MAAGTTIRSKMVEMGKQQCVGVVCENHNHWVSVVLTLPDLKLVVLDSLGTGESNRLRPLVEQRIGVATQITSWSCGLEAVDNLVLFLKKEPFKLRTDDEMRTTRREARARMLSDGPKYAVLTPFLQDLLQYGVKGEQRIIARINLTSDDEDKDGDEDDAGLTLDEHEDEVVEGADQTEPEPTKEDIDGQDKPKCESPNELEAGDGGKVVDDEVVEDAAGQGEPEHNKKEDIDGQDKPKCESPNELEAGYEGNKVVDDDMCACVHLNVKSFLNITTYIKHHTFRHVHM
jgi:hypothetical protein